MFLDHCPVNLKSAVIPECLCREPSDFALLRPLDLRHRHSEMTST